MTRYFGVPMRNGLPIGLGSNLALGKSGGIPPSPSGDALLQEDDASYFLLQNKRGYILLEGLMPTLWLDFQNSTSLDPRITFTRATTATYFNSSGVLTTAASGSPRFDYNPSTLQPRGLLIEEQRTNSLTYSRDLTTNWTGFGASITSSTTLAPDGVAANKFVESVGLAEHGVFQTTTTAGSNALSIYLKNNGRRYAVLRRDTGVGALVVFDLQAGAVTQQTNATGAITAIGNGWYRCELVASGATGNTVLKGSDVATGVVTNSMYTGDGVSGFFVYGAQLEAGAFATSYIPTTTTALTRNADVASMTGTNFSSWYNNAEYTIFHKTLVQINNDGIVYGGVGNSFNDTAYFSRTAPNQFAFVRSGGSETAALSVSFTPTAGVAFQQALAVKADDFAFCVNGGTVSTDTSGAVPTSAVRLSIGNAPWTASGGGQRQQWVQRITFYPTRLPNSTLQALTA